jgi:hypothetical protein
MIEKIVNGIETANCFIEDHPMPFIAFVLFFYTLAMIEVF